jgi:hypothetical protein
MSHSCIRALRRLDRDRFLCLGCRAEHRLAQGVISPTGHVLGKMRGSTLHFGRQADQSDEAWRKLAARRGWDVRR